jgi:tape measure domain-containing protein
MEKGGQKRIKAIQKETAEVGKALAKKLKAHVASIQSKNKEAANFNNKTMSMRVAADKFVNSYLNGIKRGQAASDKAAQKEVANQNKIKKAYSSTNQVWAALKRGTTAYLGVQSLGGVINTSDSLTMAKARMNVVGDGVHSTEELMSMIYGASMRSRSGYLDMAASVSKVAMQAGSLFRTDGKQNNAAIVRFMENYNKMAAISGATQQQTSAAMLQIVQALSSGELRGDELRSVLENMPVVADYIAKKMGVARDQILSLGHDGKISAETLRDAVMGATEDLDEKMKKMPYTWGQVWTIFKNAALKAFEPVLNGISAILKNEKFLEFANGIGNALVVAGRLALPVFNAVGNVIGWIYDKVKAVYNFISDNFGWIAPLVLGIAAALGVMYVAINAVAWATAISASLTKAWTAVQAAFNAVMAMNPVAWVIIAIIALIAVIYIVIAVINQCCDTSISATGIIFGAFAWLGVAIYDVFIFLKKTVFTLLQELGNQVIDINEWIYNAFNGGFTGWIDGVQNALWTFVNWALQLIKPLIEVWDKIKGTNYSASLQSTVDSKLNATKSDKYKEFGRIDLASKLEYANPNEWYRKGYSYGDNLSKKVEGFFDFSEYTKGLDGDKVNDFYKALTGGFDNPAVGGAGGTGNPVLDKISGDTGDIAKNTGKSEEDFSYLRELAEREAINKYTLTDLKIDMTNNNNISNGVDSDSVMRRLAKQLSDAVLSTAEGITPW